MEYSIAIIFGLFLGSFLNVVNYRIPRGESLLFPPSTCPSCGTRIKARNNIPVLSWFILLGKCPDCKSKISFEYPLIEFLSGAIFALVTYKLGVTVYSVMIATGFVFFLSLSTMDHKSKMVPDSINLLVLTVFAIASFFTSATDQLINSMFVMAGLFALLRYYASYFFGQEALGEADIMVAASIGVLLGWEKAILAVFISQIFLIISALIYRSKEVPMIPSLLIGTILTFMCSSYADSIIKDFLNGLQY